MHFKKKILGLIALAVTWLGFAGMKYLSIKMTPYRERSSWERTPAKRAALVAFAPLTWIFEGDSSLYDECAYFVRDVFERSMIRWKNFFEEEPPVRH
jgi:hypothetical protein